MAKLLTGKYGEEPEAESIEVPLKDCHQRLSMKPSDFVSEGPPRFFRHSFEAGGRYLVCLVSEAEIAGNPIWKPGYYLLPLKAVDALKLFQKGGPALAGQRILPVTVESRAEVPPQVMDRARRWADQCQPLFFKCSCDHLELKLDAPWALRKHWRVRLRCPDRCQPVQTEQL